MAAMTATTVEIHGAKAGCPSICLSVCPPVAVLCGLQGGLRRCSRATLDVDAVSSYCTHCTAQTRLAAAGRRP
jgi:hypothetical protein